MELVAHTKAYFGLPDYWFMFFV